MGAKSGTLELFEIRLRARGGIIRKRKFLWRFIALQYLTRHEDLSEDWIKALSHLGVLCSKRTQSDSISIELS